MSKQPLPEGSVPFTDILGYDGYMRTAGAIWQRRTYYAVTDHGTFPIAGSFGYEGPRDYSVDLDGAGEKELAANVQYGGDGHRDVFVYQHRGGRDLEGRPGPDRPAGPRQLGGQLRHGGVRPGAGRVPGAVRPEGDEGLCRPGDPGPGPVPLFSL